MRIRPASLYRNLLLCGCGLAAIYLVFCVIFYDDGTHIPIHKVQKHLYLTVSKDRIGGRFDKLAPKRILQWTTIFQQKPDGSNKFIDCPGFTDRCIVDSDKSRIDSADAVLFHSADFTNQPFPDQSARKQNQRYVYLSMEAPHNSGKYKIPNEIMSLPKNFFNWTATYLSSSDVLFKYGPFWIPVKDAESKGFKVTSFYVNERALNKPNKGIFGLISNCHTISAREQAIEALEKFVHVTIGGKCAKDKNLLDICPAGDPCDSVFEKYPFYIAIENSICNDYVTEKYWTRIHLASVPIVMRRKTYESSNPPPKSFIAMDDFSSAEEMGKYLNYLESNSTAYREYFAWRTGMWTIAPWNAPGYRNGWCRLCERLWEENQNETMVDDVYKWFEAESQCEKDEFVKKWI